MDQGIWWDKNTVDLKEAPAKPDQAPEVTTDPGHPHHTSVWPNFGNAAVVSQTADHKSLQFSLIFLLIFCDTASSRSSQKDGFTSFIIQWFIILTNVVDDLFYNTGAIMLHKVTFFNLMHRKSRSEMLLFDESFLQAFLSRHLFILSICVYKLVTLSGIRSEGFAVHVFNPIFSTFGFFV